LDSSGGFRASLVARANPESPIDMQAVEMYLSSPEVASEEKEVFFQSFPNFNSTYSYNLITGSLLLSRPTMRERSFAALNQLKVWSEDARYSEFGDAINSARERLVKIWEVGL
ncbi:MAG: hypothetical protein KJT03_03885, partial [Verrucomicrobiae bacterium]|nr:hypothetical protein [Verrucomicrobiae bacterium]